VLVSASQKQDLRFAFPSRQEMRWAQTRSSQDDNSVGLGSCFPTFAANCAARMGHPCSVKFSFMERLVASGGTYDECIGDNVGEESMKLGAMMAVFAALVGGRMRAQEKRVPTEDGIVYAWRMDRR